MATQKFMGKGVIVKRLTAQAGGSSQFAKNLAVKDGLMDKSGKLTSKGESRNKMTAKERAIDRAGGSGTYNPKTNRVKKT